jgi:hypothetical protein
MTGMTLKDYTEYWGTRGSVFGWCTMLQAGRSSVRVPDEVDFFSWPNPSSHTMVLGSTQPITEISTRNFDGGKKWLARRTDNLAATCEPIVWKMWEPQPLATLRASTACTGITLPFFYTEYWSVIADTCVLSFWSHNGKLTCLNAVFSL